MSSTQRSNSVRALGARRLKQATVGMVVVGVGGVAGLALHDSQEQHNASASTTQTSSTTSTDTATDSSGTGTTSNSSSTAGSSTVTATQSAPQATSGGS
jgi:cytoskeletal protein RodZ